jgi:transcriptional regulator with GAF, ATPase, and Fis domain
MQTTPQEMVISQTTEYDLDTVIQIIARIGNEVALVLDLDELLERVIHSLQDRLGYDQVTIYLVDGAADDCFSLKVEGGPDNEQVSRVSEPETDSEPVWQAIRQNRVISNDFQSEGDGVNGNPDIRSEVLLPLRSSGKTLGVLILGSALPDTFSQQEYLTALRLLGAQLATAITQAQEYDQKAGTEADDQAKQKIYSHVAQMHHIVPQIQPLGGSIRNVFDNIVRGVVEAMDYTGAVVAVVNNKDRTLPVQALAYSNFTDRQNWNKIEQMLGVQIIGKSVSLDEDPQNLAVQSCQNGSTKFSHNLFDLFTPWSVREWRPTFRLIPA